MAAEHTGREEQRPTFVDWDAGQLGCGELVAQLRLRMSSLSPGTVLHLTAADAGAREDVPAWCRVTGNHLLRSAPPEFWIQRKE